MLWEHLAPGRTEMPANSPVLFCKAVNFLSHLLCQADMGKEPWGLLSSASAAEKQTQGANVSGENASQQRTALGEPEAPCAAEPSHPWGAN